MGAVHDEICGRLVGGNWNVPYRSEAQQRFHVRIVGHRIEGIPEEDQHVYLAFGNQGTELLVTAHGAGEEAGNGQLRLLAEHGARGAGRIEMVELELLLAAHHPVQQRGLHVVVSHQRHPLVGGHLTCNQFHVNHP